jgi:hypothetical protein
MDANVIPERLRDAYGASPGTDAALLSRLFVPAPHLLVFFSILETRRVSSTLM